MGRKRSLDGQLEEILITSQAQPWMALNDSRSGPTRRVRRPFALDAGNNHRRLVRPFWEQRRTISALDCANVLVDFQWGNTGGPLEKGAQTQLSLSAVEGPQWVDYGPSLKR